MPGVAARPVGCRGCNARRLPGVQAHEAADRRQRGGDVDQDRPGDGRPQPGPDAAGFCRVVSEGCRRSREL